MEPITSNSLVGYSSEKESSSSQRSIFVYQIDLAFDWTSAMVVGLLLWSCDRKIAVLKKASTAMARLLNQMMKSMR
jgi:hypothetical protein